MIQIGMTDHPTVQRQLEMGSFTLDYLEVHGPYVNEARRAYPTHAMLLHNALYQWSLSHPDGLSVENYDSLTLERLALTRSPWYSLHLGFSSAEVDFKNESMIPLSPILERHILQERFCKTLGDLRRLLGLDFPVLVESLDYCPTGAYETVCEPDFIRSIVDETGVYLLLDLAHACISATALKIRIEDYLNQLPLDKVRQLHVNRPVWSTDHLWDAHEALQDEDYDLLVWVLDHTQPWAVTLEYNRDEAKMGEMVNRLRNLTQQYP